MIIGNREFDTTNQSYIMGILNVTPDSFSDGGKYNSLDAALKHTEQMIQEGADIIDVGGESTRPGYEQISDEEEIARVAPTIEKIKSEFDIPISLDTYKSKVAKACIPLGVDLLNDIWGLKYDEDMAAIIAEFGVACCLMHNRKTDVYKNFMQDFIHDLQETILIARAANIADDKIILDPGVGFAKSYENNLEAIAKLEKLVELGFPVLLGTSRKSVVGLTLDLPKDERVEGTLATTVIGKLKGASFFRVHDVKENARILKMTDAIKRFM